MNWQDRCIKMTPEMWRQLDEKCVKVLAIKRNEERKRVAEKLGLRYTERTDTILERERDLFARFGSINDIPDEPKINGILLSTVESAVAFYEGRMRLNDPSVEAYMKAAKYYRNVLIKAGKWNDEYELTYNVFIC